MPKVLLIDDDARVLSLLCRFLFEAGFEVVTADSGDQGLQRLKEDGIDLVISDMDLRDLPGIELLRHIKGINEWLSVIMVSASEDVSRRDQAISLGASGYLFKPFDLDCLLAMIKRTFGGIPQETKDNENIPLSFEERRR